MEHQSVGERWICGGGASWAPRDGELIVLHMIPKTQAAASGIMLGVWRSTRDIHT